LEANPEETEPEAAHEEVPKEDAAMKTFGALKKRHGDRHLVGRRRGQPKKRTQGDGGSRKQLAAACRGMARRAIPATRKGHGHQGPGKDNVVQGPRKETSGQTGMQQRYKEPRLTGVTTF
jgi:hypothetical protein